MRRPTPRLAALVAVVLVVTVGVGWYVARAAGAQRHQVASAPSVASTDLASALAAPHVVFRSTLPGPQYGQVAVVPLADPAGPRAFTDAACDRLYTVGTTKDVLVSTAPDGSGDDAETAVRRYVSVDGGMSDNARPALYEAQYSARIANRVSDVEPALVRVAGKHCESGDIVVDADYLPGDVAPGDLLAVAATGAYCWSLASNYNYIGRPAVVAVRDGSARVIVRGETEEDLLARDAAYEGVKG